VEYGSVSEPARRLKVIEAAIPDDWKPTVENISALPAPLRRFIYALN
jgi:hypothetical protein